MEASIPMVSFFPVAIILQEMAALPAAALETLEMRRVLLPEEPAMDLAIAGGVPP